MENSTSRCDVMPSQSSQSPVIVWFRQDLRIADNPALVHAVASSKPVLALYVHDEFSSGLRSMGGAQKWWLHHSLGSLGNDLQKLGCPLIFKSGSAADVIDTIAAENNADMVVWNRRYGAAEQSIDAAIKASFKASGKTALSFDGLLLHEPALVKTKSDAPYRVYTPFWKNLVAGDPPRPPLAPPQKIVAAKTETVSDRLDDWNLLPRNPDWSGGIAEEWTPGEPAAHEQARRFFAEDLKVYQTARDLPGQDRTSRVSPYLRFGEISPHQLWAFANARPTTAPDKDRMVWSKEIVWREFSYHLLHHWPDLAQTNFNRKFDAFPWQLDATSLSAWQKGMTGYPIIDAGMRQLWQTGWMHNRVRMIVGSFLVKHLRIDWREGEQWFWDTLVDGDPASNPAQWQWVAGCGADAAPYFRIFNPILQTQKFDPDGTYIHRYVPELAKLPPEYLSAPWDAPTQALEQAGVRLGETYPLPIVDHKTAREQALEALNATKAIG